MDKPSYSPFDRLELGYGETLTHVGVGGTFHRFFDYSAAATDQALYLFTHRFILSNRWQRFSYASIERVAVVPLPSRKGYVLVLSTCLFLAVCGAQVVAHQYLGAAICGGFIAWLCRESIRGMRSRTQLVVFLHSKNHKFSSPADPNEEEKPYDRRLFEELAQEAGKRGVLIEVGGMAPNPSIERTALSRLRRPKSAAHVER